MILAHKNKDVQGFNDYIHNIRKHMGELGNSTTYKSVEYSENDRFVFLENNNGLGVKNGTLGTIEKIEGQEFQIKLDTPKNEPEIRVNFNIKDYDKFAQAYALTVHKSQGVTVNNTEFYVDKTINNNLMLVGSSRHKDSLKIHCLESNFKDTKELIKSAERKELKELASEKLIQLETNFFSKENIGSLEKYSEQQKKEMKSYVEVNEKYYKDLKEKEALRILKSQQKKQAFELQKEKSYSRSRGIERGGMSL